MGMSTDALLFYGVPVGGEGSDIEEGDVLKALGIEDTRDPEGEYVSLNELCDDGKLPKGCTLQTTCSYEYPTYYLAAEKGLKHSWRGNDLLLKELPPVSPEVKKTIEAVAKALGQKAGYYLASLLG